MSSLLDIRETIVPSFFEAQPDKVRSILVPFAAELVVIARLSSVKAATDHFSQLLGRKISKRTVEDTLRKIGTGKIRVTTKDIKRAAQGHPLSSQLVEYYPDLCDPTSAFEDTSVSHHKKNPTQPAAPSTPTESNAEAPSTPSAVEPKMMKPKLVTWERPAPRAPTSLSEIVGEDAAADALVDALGGKKSTV